MFLEKIEIFGFKAIPYRLSLKFGTGVTAIIGPNGCGKSNLSDAIRWVLGEQSVRNLRGHSMEDVIFNGTADRKPLGLAEVFLTFSNAKHQLPIDYSTVSIGRRLFRSGQSDYLLNKAVCRLRDVKDLLLDTGIGSSGYSMIAREMVEAVLADDSGQRRVLLEEAAGVAKYKARKREALNKLKATEGDLIRVADIISEVEREVRTLGRQVGKARRYRRYLERMRRLDLALSRLRIHDLAARRDELEPLLTLHRADLESSRSRLAELDLELEQRRLGEVELERELAGAQSNLEELDRRLAAWDSEVKVLRERRSATELRVQEARLEVDRLEVRLESNRGAGERARNTLEELVEGERVLSEVLREREEGLREADRGWRQARVDLGDRKQLRLDLVEDHAERRAHLQQVERRRDRLGERVTERRRELEDAAAELGRRDQQRLEQRDELGRMRAETEATAGKLASASERADALESEKHELGSRIGALAERVAARESRLEVLHDLKRRYEGHSRGVQTLFAAGERRGLVGTVAEILRVPTQLVEAVETALGGADGFVVAENRETTAEHIDVLRRADGGKATFLPLDRLSVRNGTDSLDEGGVVGLAHRLVEPTDPRFQNVVDYLLGDVVIVEGRQQAFELASKASNGFRIVTLDGELWTHAGPVAGGANGSGASSPLGREQEIQTLESEVGALRTELTELGSRRQESAETLAAAIVERDALRARLESEREMVFELEKSVQAAELAVHAQTESIADIERVLSELEAEISSLEHEGAELRSAIDTARSKTDDFEAGYAELELAVARLEEERDRWQRQEQEARLEWTELTGRLSESRSETERLVGEEEHLGGELERRRREIGDGLAQVEELGNTIQRLEDELRQGVLAREDREQDLRGAEARHADSRAVTKEIEGSVRGLRRELDQQVAQTHAEELELERVRSEIESTSGRIREEYEVELLETRERLDDEQTPAEAEAELAQLRDRMRGLGPVNLLAIEQFDEVKERYDFLTQQRDDLTKAREELLQAIERINQEASRLFRETFDAVRAYFSDVFQTLFEGGHAELGLVGDELDGAIEIMARPRGKNLKSVSLMSGGERALTAISLLFAIYLAKPSPFCIMDEVDAPLDDANIDRFVNLLRRFSQRTQFIVITHNKKTMAAAERLYGVTMEEPGVSKLVSVRLEQGEIRENREGEVERLEGEREIGVVSEPARSLIPDAVSSEGLHQGVRETGGEDDTSGDIPIGGGATGGDSGGKLAEDAPATDRGPEGSADDGTRESELVLDATRLEAELEAEALLGPAEPAGWPRSPVVEPAANPKTRSESSS